MPATAAPNQYASGTFWTKLKIKLDKYLKEKINSKQYKYEIIGPSRELKNFFGNRPDADVKFDRLVIDSPSPRKTVLAYVEDGNGKRIDSLVIQLDLWVYKPVYQLRHAVNHGGEIAANNFYEATVPIKQMDERLYFRGNLNQKVATVDIPAGVPIKINMVRHQKLVQVGDMVKVSSGSKFINLEFFCKAMSSGDVGDVINLNCEEMNNKRHRGELIAPGEARLL